MAQFQPGHPGYKKKGSVNLKTKQWNEISERIATEGISKAFEELKKLKGEKYIYAFAALLKYFRPQLKQVDYHQAEPMEQIIGFEITIPDWEREQHEQNKTTIDESTNEKETT